MNATQHAMTNKQAVNKKLTSKVEQDGVKESDMALWNYLCGDGNVQHIFDYYDLIEQGK
jgi:hypothetical protein